MSVPADVRAWLDRTEQDYGLVLLVIRDGRCLGSACYHHSRHLQETDPPVVCGNLIRPRYRPYSRSGYFAQMRVIKQMVC